MLIRLKAVAAAEGLPFGERIKTFNSRRAQELAKWAEANGRGDAFHEAAFRAYFADGKNIARIEILVELAQAVNLSGKDARTVLQERTYATAVDDDWTRSREMCVTAVPAFRFNQQTVVGAQPYEVLAKLVGS
jgi:predicted DsbA family dithiol-disulfide isomerase